MTEPAAFPSVAARAGGLPLSAAMVIGAIVGASLVFPARIPVEIMNASRRPVRLLLDGAAPREIAPRASATYVLRRWHFTRVEYALLPDGGTSRGTASLSPRDFLLYDRLRMRITGAGVVVQGS